ncbi:uncharacterized protein [Henckelia pumila]|uniref:uncharacterized protein n=1 Tax=Henckelia pumila TaxID=405737 RepID=UPI003C6DE21A
MMFMRMEYTFFESTQPRIRSPYVYKLRQRSQESVKYSFNPFASNLPFNPKHGSFQSLQVVISNNTKRELIVRSGVDPGPPAPPGSPFNALSWVVAIVRAVVASFVNYKWGPFVEIKNKIEATLKTTDDLVEAVKEVAEVVEKVAEDVGEDLPQGSKLRETVDLVESLAERAAKHAGEIDVFLDKVEEEEKTTEALVESLKSVGLKNRPKESDEEIKTTIGMVEAITVAEELINNPSQDLNKKSSDDL